MATLPPDPWKTLGVNKSADKTDIRAAYKKLVLKCHPDKVQDPTLKAQKQEEFQKVQHAYELLNNDVERIRYEEQVKLQELRKQAAMLAKNMPNISASRSSTKTYELRTAERYKSSASAPKVYSYQTTSRSHEDVPLRFDVPDRTARRPSSFEKPGYREDDRKERDRDRERRSRKETEDDYRIKKEKELEKIREKERELKEREREIRRKGGKEGDMERKRGQEEKRRIYAPYIEENVESAEDQHAYSSSKSEKKRSSSKKAYEGRSERDREREREKSTASRRPPSPRIETVVPAAPPPPPLVEAKYAENLDKAATYIERSRRQSNRSVQEPPVFNGYPPVVPTPPPAEAIDDDDIPRPRARRSSHDASRSREKLPPSRDPYMVNASPKTSRAPPPLHKSYTTPPVVHEASSPPRSGINRSNTTPQEYSSSAPFIAPNFNRTQTWGAGHSYMHEYPRDGDSDDDHHRRRSRRAGRRHSPEPSRHTYKVGSDHKTTKVENYGYGASASSGRYADSYDHHASGSSYPTQFRVKETPSYTPADVKYSDANYNVAYANDRYYQVPA